jgi:hypothetical protein
MASVRRTGLLVLLTGAMVVTRIVTSGTGVLGESTPAWARDGAGSADPFGHPRPWRVGSKQAWANFGDSVGSAGDVNGDGFEDVVVGATFYDNGQFDEGRAFLYLGSATGPSNTPDWTAEPDQAIDYFGISVGTAGDVNGDGYDEVVVGAPYYDNGQGEEGRAFLYLGSPTGPSDTPDWTAESDQVAAFFGISVGTAGDVNGDGYDDVVVGAHLYDNGQADVGQAFLYLGSPTGPSPTPDWTAGPNQADTFFGHSVGAAGDVNGDGYDDVVVGAYLYDNGQTDEGGAFLYLGSPTGPSDTPDWTAESDQAGATFGWSVVTAGDVNADGYDDVVVGADGYSNGQTSEGRAFLYLGSPTGPSDTPDWTAESDQAGADFGYSVGTAGDVDGDGYDDVVVGAPYYDNGQGDEGGAFVFHGSAAGPSTRPDESAEIDRIGAFFGSSVGTAGDVNGDGYDDVVVGAYGYGVNDNGAAFVFRGRPKP